MKNLTAHVNTRETPQSEPIPGTNQVENNAGGYVWEVDPWQRLLRFLILGTQGGTYYATEKELTAESAKALVDLVKLDGLRFVRTTVEVSDAGRAPKSAPAIFALALASKFGDAPTKAAAYAAVGRVCRIGTHLFQWAEAIRAFGGFSKGPQRALARWYQGAGVAPVGDDGENFALGGHARWLALQAVKYQQREGWSHRDLLRLAKPGAAGRRVERDAATDAVLTWITKGTAGADAPALIHAFEEAKAIGLAGAVTAAGRARLVTLIGETHLPRECIPTAYLNAPDVWAALLDNGGRGMPLTAMIRNLGKMGSIGMLAPLSDTTARVVAALGDVEAMRRARVHPLGVLVALATYKSGHGARGSLSWAPVAQVVDALDAAFYTAFGTVEPTGKRFLLALDVSGSMDSGNIAGLPGITPRVGAAAMALVTAAVEPQHHIVGFTANGYGGGPSMHGRAYPAAITELAMSPRQRLDDVARYMRGLSMGGTDCALPMLYAMDRGIAADVVVIVTDNETWSGSIHPSQALQQYRAHTGLRTKLVVVGMTSNNFTIADPRDPGQMDVVGFDVATPNIISGFAMDRF